MTGFKGKKCFITYVNSKKKLQGHISKDWTNLATKLAIHALIRDIVAVFV